MRQQFPVEGKCQDAERRGRVHSGWRSFTGDSEFSWCPGRWRRGGAPGGEAQLSQWQLHPVAQTKNLSLSWTPLFLSHPSKSCCLHVENSPRTQPCLITFTATFLVEATHVFCPLDRCKLSSLLLSLPAPLHTAVGAILMQC